jgi:ABC-type sugar transport system substrate-binding protein
LLIGLILPLCTTLAADPGAAGGKQLVIGVTVRGLDYPLYAELKQAVEAEGAALGVKVEVADSHWSADRQTIDLERFIDQHVDGILLTPVTAALVSETIDEAGDARIPIVQVHTGPGPEKVLATFAPDAVAMGQMAARFVIRRLGGKGTVVELRAMGPVWDPYREAFEKELRASQVKLVLSEPIEIHRETAQRAMAAMLRKHGRIDAVVTVNDLLALGAADAVREARVDPAPKVILGLDALPEGRRAVEERVLTATIDPRVGEQTRQALRCLVEYVRTGKTPPNRLILLPPELVMQGPQD